VETCQPAAAAAAANTPQLLRYPGMLVDLNLDLYRYSVDLAMVGLETSLTKMDTSRVYHIF